MGFQEWLDLLDAARLSSLLYVDSGSTSAVGDS